ncbi:MAG: hypothetical protein CM15mP102_09780 [Flavobacteriales bacterium]|nr:MAG: hypothetical protein CM15mP102_09780 [Flavobacteriales bacterium]
MEFFLYLVLVKMRLPSHILESLIHLIQFKEDDILKNTYLKSEIFLEETDGNEVHKVIIDEYIISSNKDIILENIIRIFIQKSNLDSEFNKILNTTDFDEPFNIYTKSYNLNSFKKIYLKCHFSKI